MSNEVMIESLVISCIFQDLTLIDEYPLESNYFENPKCKFFFELAEGLSKNYKELNEVTVSTFVSQTKDLARAYEKYNAWESIINVRNLAQVSNFDKHIDDLYKQNLIKDLKSKGFNTSKKVEIDGVEVRPSDIFPEMTCQQVYEFYEMLLANSSINTTGNDMLVEDLYFTDDEIKKIELGEDNTSISYDIILKWQDEEGNEKCKKNFKNLNNLTDGISYDNGFTLLCSASGGGKSTTAFQMALGMVASNCPTVFFSNEQSSRNFKNILVAYISKNVFNCPSITRRKVKHMEFTEEERIVFRKANQFIKENLSDKLKFISVIDFNIDRILKLIKKMRLTYGFQGCVIETFKSSNAEDGNAIGELVENSRKIDKFAKKYQVRFIIPMQLRVSTNMKVSYLTSSEIAGSKQVVETTGTVMLIRKVLADELDSENKKLFLKPFRWIWDEQENKYKKKYLTVKDYQAEDETVSRRRRRGSEEDKNFILDKNGNYRLLFLDKCREGSDDKKVLLYKLNGDHGEMQEICYVDNVYTGQLSY